MQLFSLYSERYPVPILPTLMPDRVVDVLINSGFVYAYHNGKVLKGAYLRMEDLKQDFIGRKRAINRNSLTFEFQVAIKGDAFYLYADPTAYIDVTGVIQTIHPYVASNTLGCNAKGIVLDGHQLNACFDEGLLRVLARLAIHKPCNAVVPIDWLAVSKHMRSLSWGTLRYAYGVLHGYHQNVDRYASRLDSDGHLVLRSRHTNTVLEGMPLKMYIKGRQVRVDLDGLDEHERWFIALHSPKSDDVKRALQHEHVADFVRKAMLFDLSSLKLHLFCAALTLKKTTYVHQMPSV